MVSDHWSSDGMVSMDRYAKLACLWDSWGKNWKETLVIFESLFWLIKFLLLKKKRKNNTGMIIFFSSVKLYPKGIWGRLNVGPLARFIWTGYEFISYRGLSHKTKGYVSSFFVRQVLISLQHWQMSHQVQAAQNFEGQLNYLVKFSGIFLEGGGGVIFYTFWKIYPTGSRVVQKT